MAKFDDHFKIRHNLVFEWAKFNKRVQLVGESAEQYITVLYQLTENCEYGELKSKMICDRLVVEIQDDNLSQQLQMDPKLILVKAKTRVHPSNKAFWKVPLIHTLLMISKRLSKLRLNILAVYYVS